MNLSATPPKKDETDLELALLEVVQRGATHIRIIGGIGDRIDQSLGNIDLLHMSALRGLDVRLVTAEQTIWLVGVGEHVMQGAEGDTVSLLPWHGDAHHIITDGLYYPLRDESLLAGAARGMSNVMLGAEARVHVGQGQLLVVHTIGRA